VQNEEADIRAFFITTESRTLCHPVYDGVIGQTISFGIQLARDMSDLKLKGGGEFPARPIKGVQPRRATLVLTFHLLNDKFGVGEDLQSLGLVLQRVLKRFKKGDVFGYVVVLMPYPAANSNRFSVWLLDDNADSRWSRATMTTTVNIRYKTRHRVPMHTMNEMLVQGQEIHLVRFKFVGCANLCAEIGRNS
jgi:hypothetical protein